MKQIYIVISRSSVPEEKIDNKLLAENYQKLILKEIEVRRRLIKISKTKETKK